MLVRIPNWLGDALMATPVYYNLSNFGEEVYLFGPSSMVELFKFFPGVKVLPFYKEDFKKNLEILKPFKNQKALLLTNSFSSAWLFFRAGIKERWGYATDLRRFLLTRAVKVPSQKLHQRDYYLYLIEALGFDVREKSLKFYLKEEILKKTEEFLEKEKIGLQQSFVVLAPGAAYGPAKMWPINYYKMLAEKLVLKGYKVLVVGGSSEREKGEFIREVNPKKIYNLCGLTDLLTLSGIFYFSLLVVSNDSGLMHLAACLKKSQVAIFGSTDPELTGPLNSKAKVIKKQLPCSPCFKRKCPYEHYMCLKSITPEEVWEVIEKLLIF